MDDLLAWIYPNRIAIAIATIAIALPLGWYLGSPLIIRTELDEPPPVVLDAAVAPSPRLTSGSSGASGSAPASIRPSATPGHAPSPLSLRGHFVGADEFHFARGTARLVETAPGRLALRLEDFSVRNGPDLFVYLSPDPKGYAKGAIELGRLKATDGSFNYSVPAGSSVAQIRSAMIWCRAFSVQFGAAQLRE